MRDSSYLIYHNYKITSNIDFVIFTVPSVPPAVGEIVRVSATEIRVEWNEISPSASDVEIVVNVYVVRYRPHQPIQRRSIDSSTTFVEVNETNYVISGLDPSFPYAVSVAGKNAAGVGNFSEEVIIGGKERE